MSDTTSIPFLIGVTGHRDVRQNDQNDLSDLIARVIRHYQASMPNTPVVLLSGLAVGADQIAAKSALELPGVGVIAVLPMPGGEYRKDFSEQECEEFDALLDKCVGVIDASRYMSTQEINEPSYRDGLYQNAGRFIARNSSVLIAAWDGAAPEFVGGTADVVYYKSADLIPLRSRHVEFNESPVDPGLVLHLPVRRQEGEPTTHGERNVWELDSRGIAGPWRMAVDPGAAALDALNSSMRSMPRQTEETLTDHLLAVSDSIAMQLQGTYRRLLITLLASGVVALSLVALMQTIDEQGSALTAAAGIVLLALLWAYFQRRDLKMRFQSMRALAEGARVQSVWQGADVHDSVAEEYLGGRTGGAAWIRQTLRSAYVVDESATRTASAWRSAENWMREQVDYFVGSGERNGAIDRVFRRGMNIRKRAMVSGAIALIALIADIVSVAGGFEVPLYLLILFRLAWATGFALTLALVSYGEIMGFKQLAARYAVAVPIFDQGVAELSRLARSDSLSASDERAVTRIVGKQALREAGDWFASQCGRDVRPV